VIIVLTHTLYFIQFLVRALTIGGVDARLTWRCSNLAAPPPFFGPNPSHLARDLHGLTQMHAHTSDCIHRPGVSLPSHHTAAASFARIPTRRHTRRIRTSPAIALSPAHASAPRADRAFPHSTRQNLVHTPHALRGFAPPF
jgi:hypothetical protein